MTQTTPRLAIGIISAPSAVARRVAARSTWLHDAAIVTNVVAARFVLGTPDTCSSDAAPSDLAAADIVRVPTPDCAKWHAALKVHAWFRLALGLFPSVPWLGKTEDDALLWPSALVADLGALALSAAQYYGVLAWQGGCNSQANADVATTCAGCFGGSLSDGASLCRAALCRDGPPPERQRCCQVGCPRTLRMAPFALGALDVRSRHLASAVAACEYAEGYFRRVSELGAREGVLCVTADGAQGHALGECVPELALADAGSGRLTDAERCQRAGRCAGGGVAIVHPLKYADVPRWNLTWNRVVAAGSYRPSAPIVHSRLDALGGAVRAASKPPALRLVEPSASLEAGKLAARWAERADYLDTTVNQHRKHVAAVRARATATADARGSGGGRSREAAPRAARGRQLRSTPPLFMLNCSFVWNGHGHVRQQGGRA